MRSTTHSNPITLDALASTMISLPAYGQNLGFSDWVPQIMH